MKFKSIMTVAAVATAGVAFAKVESKTTLCQIQVSSSYTNTVIALPLVEVGGTEDTINPVDYVLTDGLEIGSYIYTQVGKEYKGWVLTSDGWEQVPAGEGSPDIVNTTEVDGDGFVDLGSAVWLCRKGAALSSNPIYIRGQICDSAVTNEAIGAYTMIGNASTNAVRLTGLNWVEPPAVGDKVMFIDDSAYGVSKEFTCSSSSPVTWTYEVTGTKTVKIRGVEKTITTFTNTTLEANSENDLVVKPGEGFYFYRVSTEGTAPKIEW